MRIQLKLMGVLKSKMPEGGELELANGASVEAALRELDIKPESVQMFTVNGSMERDQARTLADGDELSVIAPVGGG
jgi:sulfur carrier protein ThiS